MFNPITGGLFAQLITGGGGVNFTPPGISASVIPRALKFFLGYPVVK